VAIIKHKDEKLQVRLIDYFILLFILSIAFYMFNNTRFKVTSNSFDENGNEFPYITSIDYTSDSLGENVLDEETIYFNKEKNYYIKLSFNKELIISENVKIRVLFNNSTYIEEQVAGNISDHIVIKGNNELHYENELKITGIQVVNGYIKDENNHELNSRIREDVVNMEQSIVVLNNMPTVSASSVKSFYTDNLASILIETNEQLVDSYCISENDNCSDETFKKYESNLVEYTFDTNENEKEVCVSVRDKAGNLSSCSTVEFNYYPSPEFDFKVEEGNVINGDSINVNVNIRDNEYLNLIEYCLALEKENCVKKSLTSSIDEEKKLDGSEGIKTLKFVLYDDAGNEYEYAHKIVVDKTKPNLKFDITNENVISNYKDVLVSFTDDYQLDSNNKYEYYLSTSSDILDGGKWSIFENNKPFRIRNVKDGNYYLWIKNINDAAGNSYSENEIFFIGNMFKFDNSKPFINIQTDEKEISDNNLSKEFVVTYKDNNKIKETILDSSSLVINCTNDSTYNIKIKQELNNGWIVEVTFDKESLTSGYFTLMVLSNLIEDEAGNRNDSITSNLIKIN
jgi:hypothetical protein